MYSSLPNNNSTRNIDNLDAGHPVYNFKDDDETLEGRSLLGPEERFDSQPAAAAAAARFMVADEMEALCAHGSGFASRERCGGHKTIRNEFRQIDAAAASNDSRAKHLSEPNRTEPEQPHRTEPRCTQPAGRKKYSLPPSPTSPSAAGHRRHRGGLLRSFSPPALSPRPYLYRPLPAGFLSSRRLYLRAVLRDGG